ncbi:MAG: tetraacyldisaccharide 4'-kinase [Bacteroidia bacterium]
MKFLRILALPLALLYGLAVWLRNKLYDKGYFRSVTFSDIALIGVGNLSAGGTGKTPHVEYLIRLLSPQFKTATLSRGYGRRTSGFLLAQSGSTTRDIGDEPMQFRNRFPADIPVAVDGNRVRGVKKLKELFPELDTIVLDDVFQHRGIKPGLQIMLTDYSNLFYQDFLLPTGMLRESRKGAQRADIIIVTKTPELFSPLERKRILKEMNPLSTQQVYFSYIRYGDFLPLDPSKSHETIEKDLLFELNPGVILLTGIANAHSLEYYLKSKINTVVPCAFNDHHEYTAADIRRLQEVFNEVSSETKIILTTEKDAMRLRKPELKEMLDLLPVYYVPIEVAFHDKDEQEFNEQILKYVRTNSGNSRAH